MQAASSPVVHGQGKALTQIGSAILLGAGFACILLWLSLFGSHLDALESNPLPGGGFLWVAVGLLSAAAVLLLCKRSGGIEAPSLRRVDICAGALGLLASIAGEWFPVTGLNGWIIECVVGAVAATWILLRWGDLLGRASLSASLFCVGSAAVLLFAGKLAALIIGSEGLAFHIVLAALPLMSSLCLALGCESLDSAEGHAFYTRENAASLAGIVAFFALFSVALRLMDSVTPRVGQDVTVSLIAGAVMLAVGLRLFAFKRPLDFFGDVRTLLVATSIATAICVLATGPLSAFGAALSLGIRELTRFYLFLLQADIARHSEYSGTVVFGVGWACCGIPRIPFCWLQPENYDSTTTLVAILLIVVVSMACSLVKPPSGLRPPFSDITPEMTALPVKADPSVPNAAHALAQKHGLTDREVEILLLICSGRTRSYIADTLYISENTVKFHTKNLYRKVGISSKQELIDLFNGVGKSDR